MFRSCTKRYQDESDEKAFRFTFYCDSCGRPYTVAPLCFTDGMQNKSDYEKELWELKWQSEHALAFERANHEAGHHFFCCPGCGEYVCQDCIISEKTPDGALKDLCWVCSTRAHKNEPPALHMVAPAEKAGTKKKGGCCLWPKGGYRR